MPMKTILVALDGTAASVRALEAGVAIQKAHGAYLTGYVAIADGLLARNTENLWLPPAIRKSIDDSLSEAGARIGGEFRAATGGLQTDRVHLIEDTYASDTSVAEASRFFDVTVVGIPEKGAPGALHPDRIALLSGRPVLAFPAGADASRVARTAMIAWDGSRASARALGSAMRLLDTKDSVTVVTIGDPARARSTAPGLDPVTTLERHSIPAHWTHVAEAGGVGRTLLDQASAIGAEVIVMGAFEHSKFREDLFGGVTHDVMAETTIPLFLAH